MVGSKEFIWGWWKHFEARQSAWLYIVNMLSATELYTLTMVNLM